MSSWFVALRPSSEARSRLVVFPHAGGGPASLAALVPLLAPDIEPWSLNLPGRQARLAEPARTDLAPLVADLAADLAAAMRPPYALFGYCSGALLAYLVCRRLNELGHPPSRLLPGSFAAPDIATVPRRLHLLPTELFWQRLIDYGGIPPELAQREELRPVLEPALRADFGLLASYRHVPGPPFATPITVLYGKRDTSLTRGGLLGWRRQTRQRPALREIAASHWLVDDAPAEVAAALTEDLC
jgi:surfactin synthase thioesterase subunit